MMTSTDLDSLQLNGSDLGLVQRAVIASYDPDSLMRDLLYSLNRRLDLISTASNFERIVTDVLLAAMQEGWLRDLLKHFKESKRPAVKVVAESILDQNASSRGPTAESKVGEAQVSDSSGPGAYTGDSSIMAKSDPYLSQMIGQREPFIDRSDLRAHLRDLLSESKSRVLVLTGERPCGKSYTWFFIRQPKLLADITPVLIDLSEWKDPSTPMEVMSSIALQLGLKEPTIDKHAQQAAQARRLRDWFVGRLQKHEPDGRWLLVFDSLDHPGQREETLQLVEFLAGAAIGQRLPGLRVMLLGYADRLLIDPLDSVLTEEIGEIEKPQLRDFFRLLAQNERLNISDDAIDVAVQWVLSQLPPERELKLRQLPKTVRQVGNAAFGRKVMP